MNDENQNVPPTSPEPVAPPPMQEVSGQWSAQVIEEGRTFAILSYALGLIGLPFFLVPLIIRDNDFSLYHAKQCLILWLGGIAVSVIGGILTLVCIGIVVLLAGFLTMLVLDIIGLINAIKGEVRPLPVIGTYAVEWFKGLRKV